MVTRSLKSSMVTTLQITLRNKGAAYLAGRREKSAAQAGDRRPSSGISQTAVGFGVWTRWRRSGLVIGRGPIAVMMPLLLQVRHGRGLLQLLQLDDGPIRVRGRRRWPAGHHGGRHETVQSGQPVTHRARNRQPQQWVTSERVSDNKRDTAAATERGDDPCAPPTTLTVWPRSLHDIRD